MGVVDQLAAGRRAGALAKREARRSLECDLKHRRRHKLTARAVEAAVGAVAWSGFDPWDDVADNDLDRWLTIAQSVARAEAARVLGGRASRRRRARVVRVRGGR